MPVVARTRGGGVRQSDGIRTFEVEAARLSSRVGVDLTAPHAVARPLCGAYGCVFRVIAGRGTRGAIKITSDVDEAASVYKLIFLVGDPPPASLIRVAYVFRLHTPWGRGRQPAYAIIREWLEPLTSIMPMGRSADEFELQADEGVLAALRTLAGVSATEAQRTDRPYVMPAEAAQLRAMSRGTPWGDLFKALTWMRRYNVTYYDWSPGNLGVRLLAGRGDYDIVLHDLSVPWASGLDPTKIPRLNPSVSRLFDDVRERDAVLALIPEI